GIGRTPTETGPQARRSRSRSTPSWDDMAVRVVFVRSKSPAGLEPRIAKEAGTLSRSGFEVHVILWDRELAHPAEEDRAGLRIHRFRLRAPEGQPALAWLLPRWWPTCSSESCGSDRLWSTRSISTRSCPPSR